MNSIEQLLSQPLPTIKDGGFSKSILLKLEQAERQRRMVFTYAYAALCIFSLLFLPLKTLLANFSQLLTNISHFQIPLFEQIKSNMISVFSLSSPNSLYLSLSFVVLFFIFYDTQRV